jgi:class 3 adenylate cyclase/tetratricopeptide (TPR) repeat protein
LDSIMDIGAWLVGLGLGQYEALFRESEIDAEILPDLTESDLGQLGMPLGHRKRLLKAIAALSAPAETPPEPGARPMRDAPDSAERRQLTVMFCDLVGSTALAARLDPEDMSDLIRAFHGALAAAVARFDGNVAKLMGDGALIYFGYPRAHEDDAERAVRAALALLEAMDALPGDSGVALEMRAGIATGLVVVGELMGEGEARERGVVGETPNLAARLQALAEPGSIVVAESTRRLLGGAFALRALGPQSLKGFADPVPAWTILREADNLSRFEAATSHAMTPFVGREHETALLMDRWRDACDGEGQVALLSGEAGIGKSRILAALRERIAAEPHVTSRCQCSPHHIDDAFYPLTNQIRHAAGLLSGEPPSVALGKLETIVARSDLEPEAIIPLLAALLSIPAEGHYALPEMAPSELKERTIGALIALFVGLARDAPMLALLEDAHWIDPTSLDVFNRIIERLPSLRVLLVVTFRPDFAAPWVGRANVATLPLNRLGRRQARAMIDRVTGGRSLPEEVLEQIVAKTDGVPLFLEELTKTVMESGLLREEGGAYVLDAILTPLAIPSTLQDSLMARLDRLAPVKGTAQIGAAIGREFSYRLLEAVSPIMGPALQDALGQLMAAELIYGRGSPPDSTYVFKHALVQDTAYATLLKSRRQQLHQLIAETIRDRFPERADSEPGIIAHHFTQAGLLEMAVEWWSKSGRRAMSRFANFEAVKSLTNGLGLTAKMPKGEALDKQELSLRLALGPPLLATRGYASNDVERNYEAANRLAETLADREAAFTSARGLWNCFYDRGDQNRSLVLAERLLALASESDSAEKRALALRALGSSRMSRAEFGQSLEAFDGCIAASTSLPLGACIERHGEEPRIVATQYRGLVLCMLGFVDQALEATRLAATLAKTISHPLSMAFASSILCIVFELRRDFRACETLAKEQLDYCKEQGFAFWSAAFQVHHGVAVANLRGEGDSAIEAETGIVNWVKTGAFIHVPTWSSFLADAALVSGDMPLAEKALTSGIEIARRNGEVFALAELQRLNGSLLLMKNRRREARDAFAEAVETAGRQGARLYLLRAARHLAQMLAEDADPHAARALLQPVVEDFPEHRDGPDFREAAELLTRLS